MFFGFHLNAECFHSSGVFYVCVFEFLLVFMFLIVIACFLDFIGMLDVCNPQVCVLAAGENQSKKNGRHCNLLEDGATVHTKQKEIPKGNFDAARVSRGIFSD